MLPLWPTQLQIMVIFCIFENHSKKSNFVFSTGSGIKEGMTGVIRALEGNTNDLPICLDIKTKKSNHRILPPLRKVPKNPRIRVVRIYTETSSGCRIGVDCASFDLACSVTI